MYVTLAIITALIFFYSLIAKGVEKTVISGPMVFVAIGVLVGAHGLGWLGETTTRAELRVFADLTLALILFIDAANADMEILKRQFKIPSRMLLLGLETDVGCIGSPVAAGDEHANAIEITGKW